MYCPSLSRQRNLCCEKIPPSRTHPCRLRAKALSCTCLERCRRAPRPYHANSITTQIYLSQGVPPAPENVFPQQGEQCSVEEFSYKGYSPPKCTCNGKHTHIQVKICTFLLECLHAMPYVSSSRQLPHTCICRT